MSQEKKKSSAKKVEIPPVQVALDLIDLPRAIQIAEEAVKGILAETGDISKAWVEAGTPLIKSEGMNAVRELRAKFPGHTICADMKVMDAGATEVEIAAKAGANIVFILGCAPDSCISEAILAGKKYGVKIAADLISVKDPPQRAVELGEMGIDIVNVHVGLDQQVRSRRRYHYCRRFPVQGKKSRRIGKKNRAIAEVGQTYQDQRIPEIR